MRYRINQIKLKPGQPLSLISKAVAHKLGRKELAISDVTVVKESIDARKKPNVKLVYVVEFSCDEKLDLPEAVERKYREPFADEAIAKATKEIKSRPVVAGYGPSGMFAALMLAKWGFKPIILERGQKVEERIETVRKFWESGVLDTESNVQFGEGGAGTFSDGKLTTGVKDVRNRFVLEEFVMAGADREILYKQKPHIGTDMLRDVVRNIRIRTEELGGEFKFGTRLDGIRTDETGALCEITIHDNSTGITDTIRTDHLILATGHSAADTFRMLYDKGMDMEQKPFSIGVRIEHPQEDIDEAQYGDKELVKFLGHAEYKMNYRTESGRGVYTFCMCPGGQVINSSSIERTVVTNGMSNSARDSGTANSGLLVDVRTSDFESEHPLAGIEFQHKYEKLAYEAATGGASMPVTNYGHFRDRKDDPVRKSLPDFAQEAIIEAMPHFGRKIAGFDRESSVMTGVETRSSSPVRILRDSRGESSIKGIMPAGEGPGYAGGIMSAAIDGIKTAEKLVAKILDEKETVIG
ncbi:MAG: NAD(FAD)-utilizing dehydrogenase [Bacillota bacterium]|nr:NAD(FAD)-utilizing dehydrogenase [Bacillota bacterium]